MIFAERQRKQFIKNFGLKCRLLQETLFKETGFDSLNKLSFRYALHRLFSNR